MIYDIPLFLNFGDLLYWEVSKSSNDISISIFDIYFHNLDVIDRNSNRGIYFVMEYSEHVFHIQNHNREETQYIEYSLKIYPFFAIFGFNLLPFIGIVGFLYYKRGNIRRGLRKNK